MATSRIDRSDDTAAVLKIVATVSATEDAVTKEWQSVTISDSTSPAANKLAVNVGGAASVIGAANSGVDIGDVTINNAAGAAAVNVQDGGNALTVDWAGTAPPIGAGLEATALRVTLATDSTGLVSVDDNGASLTVDGTVTVTDGLNVEGDVAHDTGDSGNPVKVGGVAVSGSATPTSVAAADRVRWIFNQHGIPYVMGGHPNLITREYDFGTVAQTDLNLAAALVAADERIYVVAFGAYCDVANTVAVSVRAGFGTASVPTASATGVSGMIGTHPGLNPGSGFTFGNGAGLIAVGGVGAEPRITTSAATGGNLHVLIAYYLIDETP